MQQLMLIKSIIEKLKIKKLYLFAIIITWLILTILIGVFIGLNSKPNIMPLSPEEENARIINSLKHDEEKILKGDMLSTKNNLNFDELEYSRNFIKSRE